MKNWLSLFENAGDKPGRFLDQDDFLGRLDESGSSSVGDIRGLLKKAAADVYRFPPTEDPELTGAQNDIGSAIRDALRAFEKGDNKKLAAAIAKALEATSQLNVPKAKKALQQAQDLLGESMSEHDSDFDVTEFAKDLAKALMTDPKSRGKFPSKQLAWLSAVAAAFVKKNLSQIKQDVEDGSLDPDDFMQSFKKYAQNAAKSADESDMYETHVSATFQGKKGGWITTETGHRVFIPNDGSDLIGNPKVLAKLKNVKKYAGRINITAKDKDKEGLNVGAGKAKDVGARNAAARGAKTKGAGRTRSGKSFSGKLKTKKKAESLDIHMIDDMLASLVNTLGA